MVGFRFGMAGGVACAVSAPPSARGVRTGLARTNGRVALQRVRGTCARRLGFAFDRLTRRARRFPARGRVFLCVGVTTCVPRILHHFTRTGEGHAPARPISLISELPPTHPSDFDIIRVAFRFSEGSIGRELMRQHAVFHPATA